MLILVKGQDMFKHYHMQENMFALRLLEIKPN